MHTRDTWNGGAVWARAYTTFPLSPRLVRLSLSVASIVITQSKAGPSRKPATPTMEATQPLVSHPPPRRVIRVSTTRSPTAHFSGSVCACPPPASSSSSSLSSSSSSSSFFLSFALSSFALDASASPSSAYSVRHPRNGKRSCLTLFCIFSSLARHLSLRGDLEVRCQRFRALWVIPTSRLNERRKS